MPTPLATQHLGAPDASLAERLLTIPHRIASREGRDEFLAAAAAELKDILQVEANLYWHDIKPDAARSGQHSQRLDILERGAPLACLDLHRSREFTAGERKLLEYLALSLSHVLTMRAQQVESLLLANLSSSLPGSDNLGEAAEHAASAMVGHLAALGAAVFMNTPTGFQTVASAGDWPSGRASEYDPFAAEAPVAGGARMHRDGLLACPVGGSDSARYLLVVRFPTSVPYLRAFLPSLEQAARTLAPHLESRWRTEVLAQLLKLHEASTDTPTQVMYDRMLDAAIRLVPGADSGSLLVRTDVTEPFEFRAARGYNLDGLAGQSITLEEAIAWYGPDTDGWNSGLPREIRSDQTDIAAFGQGTTPDLDAITASYDVIHASLCLPVLREGQVMGTLNLENQHNPRAFGRDAREILQLFGAPLASLLHRQHTQDVLTHAALTDELTGAMNRRAFRGAFRRELDLSQRSGRKLSILMMDLKHFKWFNDTYGHDVGDDVLITAARVLQENLRGTDYLSRWGGDEFAAILVDAPVAQARETAERLRQAAAAVTVQGRPILIDVGCATAPDDGTGAEEILALADQRMFEDKRRGS